MISKERTCSDKGGVICNKFSEVCMSDEMMEDGCCIGKCYDYTKKCSELGGIIVDNYNNCDGDRVNSEETMIKGPTNVCCIGEYVDRNTQIQCESMGGVICYGICSAKSNEQFARVVDIDGKMCCYSDCINPTNCNEAPQDLCAANRKCAILESTGEVGCVFKTCTDIGGKVCNEGEECNGVTDYADIYNNNSYADGCCIGECVVNETVPNQEIIRPCIDSDGGKNIYVKGNISGTFNSSVEAYRDVNNEIDVCIHLDVQTHYCEANNPDCRVFERFCESNGYVNFEKIVCPNGCSEGACIQ